MQPISVSSPSSSRTPAAPVTKKRRSARWNHSSLPATPSLPTPTRSVARCEPDAGSGGGVNRAIGFKRKRVGTSSVGHPDKSARENSGGEKFKQFFIFFCSSLLLAL